MDEGNLSVLTVKEKKDWLISGMYVLLAASGFSVDKSKTGYSSHVFLEGNKDPTLSSQLTQGLEYNALKNDQVLGLLQVGLRLRGQAHYSLGGLYPSV